MSNKYEAFLSKKLDRKFEIVEKKKKKKQANIGSVHEIGRVQNFLPIQIQIR